MSSPGASSEPAAGTASVPPLPTGERAVLQRRTLRVLMSGVLPAGAATAGGFSAAALLGEQLTDSAALGTLAAACTTVGATVATIPLAQRMSRRGRGPGLVMAWTVAATGALACLAAAVVGLYPLLLVGLAAHGYGNAAGLAARFAAADLAAEDARARAIGLLVWAGSFGAVVGPSLALGAVGTAAEAIGLPALAGPYLASVVLYGTAVVVVHRGLRPDPLVVVGGLAPEADGAAHGALRGLAARIAEAGPPLRTIARQPTARLAAAAMLVGHGVMVAVMTATPLHMDAGRHELQIIGLVISLHIVGMYLFAPLVGLLVDRVDARLVLAAGGVLLFSGAELASHTRAVDSQGVFVGLFLLGLGWSFGLIAGSSLLTGAVTVAERVGVQGAADLLMSAAGTIASLTAGVAYELRGFDSLSHGAGLVALSITAAAILAALRGGRRRPADVA